MNRRPQHTDEEIKRAAQAAEELDPANARVRDVGELRAVADAADAVKVAESHLREAVAVAYLFGGYSWNRIADALGVSRQGARQRYAEWIELKRRDPEFQERMRQLLATEPEVNA
jgi:hypothetical protein